MRCEQCLNHLHAHRFDWDLPAGALVVAFVLVVVILSRVGVRVFERMLVSVVIFLFLLRPAVAMLAGILLPLRRRHWVSFLGGGLGAGVGSETGSGDGTGSKGPGTGGLGVSISLISAVCPGGPPRKHITSDETVAQAADVLLEQHCAELGEESRAVGRRAPRSLPRARGW